MIVPANSKNNLYGKLPVGLCQQQAVRKFQLQVAPHTAQMADRCRSWWQDTDDFFHTLFTETTMDEAMYM